jgi:hypothetical protein
MPYNTNFIVNINGQNMDLGTLLYKWNTNVINIPASGTTLGSYTINYTSPTIIRESDISVSMDGQPVNGDQVYTFGPLIQSRTVILGQSTGTGNSVVFSNDGFQFNGTGTTQIPAGTGAVGLCYDGIKWVTSHQSGTKNIGYSYNGINWQTSGTISPTANYPWRIAYNGRIYILLVQGTPSAIYYSYDGFNWTQTTSLFSSRVFNIAWNGNFWLAVGSGGNSVASSPDGINWTGSVPFSTLGSDICWIGNKWVITANNGGGTPIISYNTNPSGLGTWTTSNTTLFTTSTAGEQSVSLAWNGQILIASGVGGNTFAYSADGISWTGLGSLIYTAGTRLYPKSLWNGRLFINGYAQGNQANLFATSTNGTNWIGQGNIIFPYDIGANSRRMNSITFQKNMTILSASTGFYYSLDGINWNLLTITASSTNSGWASYNGRTWLALNRNASSNCFISNDGINWKLITTSTIFSAATNLYWARDRWFITSTAFGSTTSTISYSYDGATWIPTNTTIFTGGYANSVYYNGSIYIATGTGTNNSIGYSYDGINWVGLGKSIANQVVYAYWNGTLWIGGASDTNTLSYSYNGINWTGLGRQIFSGQANRFVNNGVIQVAVGVGGNTIAYSYNGINWTGLGLSIFSSSGNDICWNGTLWIASGSGTNSVAYSYNGINWTGITNSYNNGWSLFTNYGITPIPFIQHPTLAFGSAGTNSIAYSPDGITWTGLGKTVFSTGGYCGYWNGSIWLAGGQGGNTMAFSYDGINWTGLGSSVLSTYVAGIAYNGIIWVATGVGVIGNIAYSYNGFNWTEVNGTTVTMNSGLAVVWNGTCFVVGSSSPGSSSFNMNSTDGINWSRLNPTQSARTPASNGYTWVMPRTSTPGIGYINNSLPNNNSWTTISQTIFSSRGTCIFYGGFIWLAGGIGTGNTLAYSYDGMTWTGLGITNFPGGCTSICWNGTRFVGIGTTYVGYSADGITWYSSSRSLFTTTQSVVSNASIGAYLSPSAMVLNNNGITGNGMYSSQTLEVVSSDPYFQSGFTNVSFNITSNSVMKP